MESFEVYALMSKEPPSELRKTDFLMKNLFYDPRLY